MVYNVIAVIILLNINSNVYLLCDIRLFYFNINMIYFLHLQPILDRLGNWPWCSPEDGGLGEKEYRYSLTSLSQPQRCIGFARRRVGRGGRCV